MRYALESILTHWGRVTHICVSKLTIIGSDNGLAPNHYLNQWWNIVNWTLRNKLQWNFNRNSNIFIEENTFENVVCEMSAILPWPQCVKWYHQEHWEGVSDHQAQVSGQEQNLLWKCHLYIYLFSRNFWRTRSWTPINWRLNGTPWMPSTTARW